MAQFLKGTANRTFADTATRIATTGIYDGEIVVQLDNNLIYTWDAGTNTWKGISSGAASSTDNALVRFDGTTGQLLQNSVVVVGDTGDLTISEAEVFKFTYSATLPSLFMSGSTGSDSSKLPSIELVAARIQDSNQSFDGRIYLGSYLGNSGTPKTIAQNQFLGSVNFGGQVGANSGAFNAANQYYSCGILARADETWTANTDMGSRLEFRTCPINEGTTYASTKNYVNFAPGKLALTIGSDQKLWLGDTLDTNLYRSAANVLATDDEFRAAPSNFRSKSITCTTGTTALITNLPSGGTVYVDLTSASVTLTLPDANTYPGITYKIIIKVGSTANICTVNVASGDVIKANGNISQTSMIFNQLGESYTLEAQDTTAGTWNIIASHVPYDSKKNYIINGGFDFWQRGTSFTGTPLTNLTYTADRYLTSTGVNTIASSTTVPNSKFKYSLNFKYHTSGNGVFITRLERMVMEHLIGSVVTLSMWIKRVATTTHDFSLNLSIPNSENTWSSEDLSANITLLPAGSSTDWQQVQVSFVVASGFTLYGGGNATKAITNGLGFVMGKIGVSAADEYLITGITLNQGPLPAPWQPFGGSYEAELRACQRYCFVPGVFGSGGDGSFLGNAFTLNANTDLLAFINFPVTMRIQPTVENTSLAYSNFEVTQGAGVLTLTAVDYSAASSADSNRSKGIKFTSSSTFAAGDSFWWRYASSGSTPLILSAEL